MINTTTHNCCVTKNTIHGSCLSYWSEKEDELELIAEDADGKLYLQELLCLKSGNTVIETILEIKETSPLVNCYKQALDPDKANRALEFIVSFYNVPEGTETAEKGVQFVINNFKVRY